MRNLVKNYKEIYRHARERDDDTCDAEKTARGESPILRRFFNQAMRLNFISSDQRRDIISIDALLILQFLVVLKKATFKASFRDEFFIRILSSDRLLRAASLRIGSWSESRISSESRITPITSLNLEKNGVKGTPYTIWRPDTIEPGRKTGLILSKSPPRG